MRIALIAPPWLPVPPPAYGGIEAVIDRLARGLVAEGHDVLLYTTGDATCPVPSRWTLERAASTRMGRSLEELRHVIGAYGAVASYDIVHDHTLIGPVYARAVRRPLVVTTAHFPIDGEHYALYRSIAGRVPIIALSRSQLVSDIPVAGIIHHGLDVSEFPIGAGDGGYLLFLGRMDPAKGVDRAVAIARAAGAPLLIAAKMHMPWEHQYYHDHIRPLLGHGIEYVGEPSFEERLILLQGARALLNPIQWPEPFGLVMIEALACGTPVLATREGSAPEIVDDGRTGFLRHDEHELVLAIRRIDELDRRACRTAVAARFSTSRMVREHVALYERLLTREPVRVAVSAGA